MNPVPAYPIITGCNHEQYCVLKTESTGTLTCTVKGIRPQVKLEWKILRSEDEHVITFSKDEVTVEDNGETFDVTLTSAFVWNDGSRDRLTIECTVPSSNEWNFHLTTKIDFKYRYCPLLIMDHHIPKMLINLMRFTI